MNKEFCCILCKSIVVGNSFQLRGKCLKCINESLEDKFRDQFIEKLISIKDDWVKRRFLLEQTKQLKQFRVLPESSCESSPSSISQSDYASSSSSSEEPLPKKKRLSLGNKKNFFAPSCFSFET